MELYDLSPQEATMLVCPDAVWLAMIGRGIRPLRRLSRHCSRKCYRGNGFEVHVKPDCKR